MAGKGSSLGWKIVGVGSAALAAVAARKAITVAWTSATGKQPPSNPESPDVTWGEAVAWALASGAAIGLARLVAVRQAAEYWRRSTGALPAEFEETF